MKNKFLTLLNSLYTEIMQNNTNTNTPSDSEMKEMMDDMFENSSNEELYDAEDDSEDTLSDVDADSMTLASAGFGTDEDYGGGDGACFGDY